MMKTLKADFAKAQTALELVELAEQHLWAASDLACEGSCEWVWARAARLRGYGQHSSLRLAGGYGLRTDVHRYARGHNGQRKQAAHRSVPLVAPVANRACAHPYLHFRRKNS